MCKQGNSLVFQHAKNAGEWTLVPFIYTVNIQICSLFSRGQKQITGEKLLKCRKEQCIE